MEEMIVLIETDYMTLGQLLKFADVISSGGMVKWYLSEYTIYVNGEEEARRGRKLYPGDHIEIPHENLRILMEQQSHAN